MSGRGSRIRISLLARTQRGKFRSSKWERNMEENTALSVALYTVTVLLGVTLSYICRRGSFSSLRKREREEGPEFEPDSKRAKLDDETTSSSNLIAPELVPEPEAPLVIDGKKERGFPFHSTNYLFEADSSQCSFYRYWKSQRE